MTSPFLIRTYRYSLRLSRRQEGELESILEAERQLYNAALQEWRDSYQWAKRLASLLGLEKPDKKAVAAIDPNSLDDKRRSAREALLSWKSPDWFSQTRSLTMKAQRELCGEIFLDSPANRNRWTLERVHGAIDAFYKRCKNGETPGYPRFRSKARWRSFGFNEMKGVKFETISAQSCGKRGRGQIHMKGLAKTIVVKMHRPLPEGTEIRACSLTCGASGWTVNLALRIPDKIGAETDEQLANLTLDQVMGGDVGVNKLCAADDGFLVEKLQPERAAHKRVKRLQRQLARAKRGSKNRKRKVKKLAREQERIANDRRTKSRQAAAAWVKHGLERGARVLAFEKLALRNMSRSARGTMENPGRNVRAKAGLNRSMRDARMGGFVQDVQVKAESAGLRVILVDPKYTSIRCSSCGTHVPKTLRIRVHRCGCGLVLDRDVNAALNIAHRGLEMFRPSA